MPPIPPEFMEHFPFFVEYPHSLLSAILAGTKLSAPNTLSLDTLSGMQYAFSKLDTDKQKLLWLRHVQLLSIPTAAYYLSTTESEVLVAEQAAVSALRRSGSWGYIKHGIAAYLRSELQKCRRTAYHDGYCDGYNAAVMQAGIDLSQLHGTSTVLDYTIEMLSLSERTKHCLQQNGLLTIRNIIKLNEQQIYSMRGLGKQGANEIAAALHTHQILHTAWDKYLL